MKQDYLVLFTCLLSFGCLSAQQDPFFSLYRYHFNAINPAANGLDTEETARLSVRKQWMNIEGAPETQVFSFATPTKREKVSLGAVFVNDKTFIEQQTQFYLSYTYKLQLDTTRNLYLGIQAGGNSFRVNAADLALRGPVQSDPNLVNFARFQPNIGVGFYLDHTDYFLSLSAPRILNSERYKSIDGLVTTASDKVHLYGSLGFRLPLSPSWKMTPSMIGRYVSNAPPLWTATMTMDYQEAVEFGLEYNANSGWGGVFMLHLKGGLSFGYAYAGSGFNELRQLAQGSHEIYIKTKLRGKKKEDNSAKSIEIVTLNHTTTNRKTKESFH